MTKEKRYSVWQIEGKITWAAEELWEGGITRGPFMSNETAIKTEETFARENGFIDVLILVEEKSSSEVAIEGNPIHQLSDRNISTREKLIAKIDLETFGEDIIVSPDGRHVSYFERDGASIVVHVDGQSHLQYKEATFPIFSPDSQHLAYGAVVGNRRVVVFDGEEQIQY